MQGRCRAARPRGPEVQWPPPEVLPQRSARPWLRPALVCRAVHCPLHAPVLVAEASLPWETGDLEPGTCGQSVWEGSGETILVPEPPGLEVRPRGVLTQIAEAPGEEPAAVRPAAPHPAGPASSRRLLTHLGWMPSAPLAKEENCAPRGCSACSGHCWPDAASAQSPSPSPAPWFRANSVCPRLRFGATFHLLARSVTAAPKPIPIQILSCSQTHLPSPSIIILILCPFLGYNCEPLSA